MTRGETALKWRRRSKQHVNLSGKKTLVGRNSGERLFRIDHPRGKPI